MGTGQDVDARFTAFVSDSGDRLLRAAYGLTGAWSEAEDLTQDALTELYRHWKRLESPEAAYSYAKVTMVRMWVRRVRRRREVLWDVADFADAEPSGEERSNVQADVDARVDFLGLLRTLSAGQRAVLVLRYYLDCSVEDAAEQLGCTEGTVKSQSYKALRSLRILLEEA